MDIPVAPPVPQKPQQCKIVIVAGKINEAYCIFTNDLIYKGNGKYELPGTNITIDKMSTAIFNEPMNKGFVAVYDATNKVHALRPLNRSEFQKYERKELTDRDINLRYKNPEFLSEGTFGRVKAYPIHKIALKESKMSKKEDKDITDDMIKEIGIYRLLKTINCLPKMYDLKLSINTTEIQFEKGVGTLSDNLSSLQNNVDATRSLMFRLVKCLRSSASQGIIHCDLKPDNLIISENGDVLIIDWGISEIDQSKHQQKNKFPEKATLPWRAPELLKDPPLKKYSYKIDVFSLGLIFVSIFTGKPNIIFGGDEKNQRLAYLNLLLNMPKPFPPDVEDIFAKLTTSQSHADQIKQQLLTQPIFKSRREYKTMPEDLADIVSHMLEFNPQVRYTYDDLIVHPFFRYNSRERIPKLPIFINNMPIIPSIGKVWEKFSLSMAVRSEIMKYMIKPIIIDKLSIDTLTLSWQLLDMIFISIKEPKPVPEKTAKLYSIACMYIACKLYEEFFPALEDVTAFFQYEFRKVQIVTAQYEVLTILGGNVIIPSIFTYFSRHFGPSPSLDDRLPLGARGPLRQDRYLEVYKRDDIYARPFSEVWSRLAPDISYA